MLALLFCCPFYLVKEPRWWFSACLTIEITLVLLKKH